MSDHQKSILPLERVASTSRRTLWGTVLTILVSAVLFNAVIAWLLQQRHGLDNPTYVAFQEQWARLVELEGPVETLVLGDSSGRHGVDPEVLDAALATDSLNLCTMGNAAVLNAAWQLDTYLAAYGAPRRVILVAVHDLWSREMSLPLVPLVPRPWGYWEESRPPRPLAGTELRDVFLARFVPVISRDKSIEQLLRYPWRVGARRLRFSKRGFGPLGRADPEGVRRDAANQKKWTAPRGWRISGESGRALESMIMMADQYGFQFHLANAPLVDGLREDPVFGPYYNDGQEFLAAEAAAHPRVHLVLCPPAEYPAELMQNTDHIIGEATGDFTRRLAAAVAECEIGDSAP